MYKRTIVPEDLWSNIIIDYIKFANSWGCIVTNNSNYTIQSIIIEIENNETNKNVNNSEITCSLGLLKPYSIRNYIPCDPHPEDFSDDQSWSYKIKKIQGFIETKIDL